LKKVNPKLIKYVERKNGIKIPLIHPIAMAIAGDTVYLAEKSKIIEFNLNGKKLWGFTVLGVPVSIDVAETGEIAVCFDKEVILLNKNMQKKLNYKLYNNAQSFILAIILTAFFNIAEAKVDEIFAFDFNVHRIGA